LEVNGNINATVNGQPVVVVSKGSVSEGPVPPASTVPLGIQAARAVAAAKYRQMKQKEKEKQQNKEEQEKLSDQDEITKFSSNQKKNGKWKEKEKEKEMRLLPMGNGMTGKIEMDAPFHPGSVRKLTEKEIMAQPKFQCTSMMDGREVEGTSTKAVCAGNEPQHGKFRVRVGKNIYQVEWNHCYATSKKGFYVDGTEYPMP
jgi:hypothetical protein